MGLVDSPLASSDLLTLELLQPPSRTHMNTTIIDYTIYFIPYVYQVSSTTPIVDQFPMDNRHNIYVLAIHNEETSLASNSVQLPQYKKNALDNPL